MADRINSFEELEAWKTAGESVRLVYSIFRRPIPSKDFGPCEQVQRSAVSAMTNIAEGFERVHPAEKLQFYNVARASCGEVRSLSGVMLATGCISVDEHQQLRSLVAQAGGLISGLIRSTGNRTANT
jgi:four helix bundle protein